MPHPADSARGAALAFVLSLCMSSLACERNAPGTEPAQQAGGVDGTGSTDTAKLAGAWHAELTSPGGALGFGLHIRAIEGGYAAEIENGPERVEISAVNFEAGNLTLRFDGYDSEIHARLERGELRGSWSKTAPGGRSTLPFAATRSTGPRLACAPTSKPAPDSVAGAWDLEFSEEVEGEQAPSTYLARAELEHQVGGPHPAQLRGTVMTDTGDYRYLAGCYLDGALALSVFDGAHAFLFRAEVEAQAQDSPDQAPTLRGDFWSRDSYHASFTGTLLAPGAPDRLADPWSAVSLREGSEQFRFEFPRVGGEGKALRHDDPRFAGKVVIVDIFGSWCPNCNDQAPLLASWHQRYAARGIELVGLAYEFTGEAERDTAYVAKYAARHGIEFPLLVAGTSDKGDAAATLPDLAVVRSYPTTLFIGRDGKVRKIYSGFFGPATGPRHEQMVAEHEALIEALLAEPAPDPATTGRPPGPPPGPSGVDELPRLEGLDEAAVRTEFGAPTHEHSFTMGECCSEFEIELYNTYPPQRGHEQVEIRQWDWDYEGYTLTLWLHQIEGAWRVLETSRYSDDVEF